MKDQKERKMKPSECPRCSSEQIEGGPVDINEGIATQPVTCNTCDLVWQDHYRMCAYTVLEE